MTEKPGGEAQENPELDAAGDTVGETDPINWTCTNCGYHVEGELPEKCPDCGAPREDFESVPIPGM